MSIIIRAVYPYSSVYVFLAKDTFGRRGESGSVYYWSNNMAIATVQFESAEKALKLLRRLKIKNDVKGHQLVPFEEGVQIVYIPK